MAKSRQNHIQDSLGPNCRFEAGNPQMGQNGSDVWNLFGNTQDGDKCVIGQSEGGITHVYGDRTIEIVGGQKNPEGSVDIFITGLHGSIVINALENGDVCIKGRNIHMEAKEDITIKAGNNIKIQAKNILELGPGKKGYCKFTETTKRPNWHAICGYQENLLGRAGLGLRAESLFNTAAGLAAVAAGGPVAAAVANVGASAVKDLASGKVPGPASLATNLASSALSSVPGGELIGKVAQGQGIVGAASEAANILSGGLAPGAIASNIAGNVVQDIPGVGLAGEVLGDPVGAASDLLGVPFGGLSQDEVGEAVDQALEDALDNVPIDPTDVLDF
tara:strand:- start:184 stop:1182 length:999 start_codon:yes stop_codon:yes gene_type:complete